MTLPSLPSVLKPSKENSGKYPFPETQQRKNHARLDSQLSKLRVHVMYAADFQSEVMLSSEHFSFLLRYFAVTDRLEMAIERHRAKTKQNI